MDDLNIQAGVTVNAEQAERAFDNLGNKAQKMANEVTKAADKAGKATDGMGDGAEKGAEKFTRAESRMRAAIQKSTRELELLGKTASQRLEFNISDKGLDPKKFEPMLQRLREVEQRAREAEAAATGSLNNMGMSARATAAAMRGVPAQFQDIIVSLQGGQAPMTVLLQQGSQLSGMFGGAGNAAKALGTYIVGLVNPLTIAAAAVAGLGFAMYSLNGKDAALRELSAQLIGTGRASAAAVGDIKALVNELNTVPGVSKAAATAIIGEFAKVSGLGSSLFNGLGSSVADFAAATGTDLPTAAKKLAEAFADPAKGAKSLEDSLGTLTAAQILTITKMAEMGDKSGAQAALLDALKQATEGLAKQGMTPLGEATDKMSNAWDKLTTSVGNSSAFRTANEWLAKLIEKTAELTVQLSQMQPPTWLKFLPVVGPAIGAASLLGSSDSGSGGSRSVSGKVGNVEGGATGSWGPTSQEMESQVKAALDLTRSYESQSAAMEKLRGVAKVAKDALKELESQNRGNSVEAKELRERITGVNEKLAEMAKKGQGDVKAEQNAYESLIASIRAKIEEDKKELAGNRALTESQKIRIKLDEDLTSGKLKLSGAHQAVVKNALGELAAQEQLSVAAKDALKVAQARQALREKESDGIAAWLAAQEAAASSALASVRERVNSLQDEGRALVLSTTANISLAEAVERVAQARLLEKQQQFVEGSEGYLNIQREIDARKELLGLISSNEANKKFISDWKDSVSAYEDVFRRGFADMLNKGEDGWKSFTRSLATTFKTTVADQLYKAFAQPFVVNIVGNLLGLTGAIGMSAVSSGSNAIGLAGNAASLYGMGSRAMGFLGFGASAATTTGIGVGTSLANPGMAAMINPVAGTGAATGGFGSMLASIPGWGLALAGIAALGMLFSKKSTPHSGAGAIYSDAMGLQTGAGIYNKPTFGMGIADEYNTETSKAVGGIAKGLAEALDGVAKTFGKTAGFEIATAFADDSSKDGAWGQLRISQGGKDLLNWAANPKRDGIPKEFADGQAGYAEYLAAIAQDTRQVLLDMDLPSWADTMLNAIGDLSNMDQLSAVVQQIAEIQTLFVHLGDTLVGFAGMTDKAFEALLKASGGAQALAANADAFYQGFYSPEERKTIAKRQLDDKLKGLGVDINLDDPEARAKYRKLVEDQLAKASGEEAARSALKGSIAGALTSGGIDGLRGMDVGSIVRGALGDVKDLTQADIDKLTSGITSLDTAGMSLDGLKDSVGKLLEPIVGTGKGAADTAAALLGLSGEFAGLTASADDLAEAEKKRAQERADAIDKAYRDLQNSVGLEREQLDKQRDALNEQRSLAAESLSLITGVFDLVHSNARELFGQVESAAQMQAAQGMVFIEQALAAARGPGYLPDSKQLSEAIGAARGGIDSGLYVSEAERSYDRLVLANQLKSLEDISGKQKTAQEQQIELLDGQLKAIDKQNKYLDDLLADTKKQIDIANGTLNATLSVTQALEAIKALAFPESVNTKPMEVGKSGGGSGGAVFGGTSPDRSIPQVDSTVSSSGLRTYADGSTYQMTPDELYLYKLWLEKKNPFAGHAGIPAFAVGTNYVPNDMVAKIHEGERIIPAADNRALMAALQGGGGQDNTARLERMVETLSSRLEAVTAELEEIRNNTGRFAEEFGNWTMGGQGPGMVMVAT